MTVVSVTDTGPLVQLNLRRGAVTSLPLAICLLDLADTLLFYKGAGTIPEFSRWLEERTMEAGGETREVG